METIYLESDVLNFSEELFNWWSPRKYDKYDVGCVRGERQGEFMSSLMVIIDIIEDGYMVVYPRIKNIDGKIILGQDKYLFDRKYLSDYESKWRASIDYSQNYVGDWMCPAKIKKYNDTFQKNNYFTIHKIMDAELNDDSWFHWVKFNELDAIDLQIPETKFYQYLGG
jgi:hypothetical protein